MELINGKAEDYAARFTTALDEILLRIAEETYGTHTHPHMLSGHLQGQLLQQLSLMIKPSLVLEIGTFTGFSALCLAKGLADGGQVHTIEVRPEDAALSEANFKRAGASGFIQLHTGDARDIIPALSESWDLVFIDADKVSYIDYYELTLPQLKSGGYIIADNVLFHGQVLEDIITGQSAMAINAFNEHVAKDERVEQVMLTVRDGLMLIRKI